MYQGVRNDHFSKNLTCFVFLKHPFWDLPFCLITCETEFVLPFLFFRLNFWISSGFSENDSFEKGCGRKSTLRKRTKIVFDVCVTRWAENVDGYEKFLSAIAYIFEALEIIAYKMHLKRYPEWGVSNSASQKRAIVCLGILVDILFFIFDPFSRKFTGKIVSNK